MQCLRIIFKKRTWYRS